MGIFGHSESTGGRSFSYNLEDVKEKYFAVLTKEMGCHSLQKITNSEYQLKTDYNLKYNMNPGKAEVLFSDTGREIDVKIRIFINQSFWARIDAWIEKGFELLEKALQNCAPYKSIPKSDVIATNDVLVKCPKCTHSFSIDDSLLSFFCPKCGTKLLRKPKTPI